MDKITRRSFLRSASSLSAWSILPVVPALTIPDDDIPFLKPATQGYAYAQLFLAEKYRDGKGVPQDFAEAVKWFRKAADQGQANAQQALRIMYLNGDIV